MNALWEQLRVVTTSGQTQHVWLQSHDDASRDVLVRRLLHQARESIPGLGFSVDEPPECTPAIVVAETLPLEPIGSLVVHQRRPPQAHHFVELEPITRAHVAHLLTVRAPLHRRLAWRLPHPRLCGTRPSMALAMLRRLHLDHLLEPRAQLIDTADDVAPRLRTISDRLWAEHLRHTPASEQTRQRAWAHMRLERREALEPDLPAALVDLLTRGAPPGDTPLDAAVRATMAADWIAPEEPILDHPTKLRTFGQRSTT